MLLLFIFYFLRKCKISFYIMHICNKFLIYRNYKNIKYIKLKNLHLHLTKLNLNKSEQLCKISSTSPICITESIELQKTFSKIETMIKSALQRRTLLVAVIWVVVGACKNWHNWFTVNAMSGLVSVQYCKTPTIWRYGEGSERGSASNLDNLLPEIHGEA